LIIPTFGLFAIRVSAVALGFVNERWAARQAPKAIRLQAIVLNESSRAHAGALTRRIAKRSQRWRRSA
jgi:hypothetical protein